MNIRNFIEEGVWIIHEYQALLAGLVALFAAYVTARPVWRQLDRMSLQTTLMHREFLDERQSTLRARWRRESKKLTSFSDEVKTGIGWTRQYNKEINPHWAFDQEKLTRRLIVELESYRTDNRDPALVEAAIDEVIEALRRLADTMGAIHIPASEDQSGPDHCFSDEEWNDLINRADVAEQELDGLASEVSSAILRFDDVAQEETIRLRDQIKEADDALLSFGHK
ncbi:hypothetical protein NYQ83_17575 [Afifella sp. JA880]|uniref:hypothetical protein n=1 Tax=Afifella sp. JA880 TaxID=2975280 RepID=UPI0021BA7EA3|nr:hypothetical protein [Afifella sp. JA880]MCT8269090.1 hypothetical protein [Afifella sp. JA880]